MGIRIVVGLAGALMLTACASMTVSDDDVVQRTGFTLGLEPGDFTVSDRINEGLELRYKVLTKSGKKFNCSMAGSVSVLGAVPSDAICYEAGAAGASSAPSATCNALLKAANKC